LKKCLFLVTAAILNGGWDCRTHPGTIPAMFGLIWFSDFRGKDLNMIVYQNMPNLHNRYKSAERHFFNKHCCLIINQMSSNFNCSYMAMSSLTYIPGFSVKFVCQPIYTDYTN
jgi:hypothetical protein